MKKYYSPTQVNKFLNCNYQWYYGQIYTQKELRDLYTEYKKENNIKDNNQFNAFAYGNNFHKNYHKKIVVKRNITIFIIICLIIIGVLIWKYCI